MVEQEEHHQLLGHQLHTQEVAAVAQAPLLVQAAQAAAAMDL